MLNPFIRLYKQKYEEFLTENSAKADAFATEIIDEMVSQSKFLKEPLYLAYAFDLCIAFDKLTRAASLVDDFHPYASDEEYKMIIECSLMEKTPFVKGCLFDVDKESELARKKILTTLVKLYPSSAVIQYVYAYVSYYMNDKISLAIHHALFAFYLLKEQPIRGSESILLFARICGLTSMLLVSKEVDEIEEGAQIWTLFNEAFDNLNSSYQERLCSPSKQGIFSYFDSIARNKSIEASNEFASLIVADAKSDGDVVYYAQACAVKAKALLALKHIEDAFCWIKRASAVYDDPRFTKIEADILFNKGRYDESIPLYKKANIVFLNGQNVFDNFDNGVRTSCIIPRFEINELAVEAHKKHIQAAIRIRHYEEAQQQIDVAQKHYGSAFDWTVFVDHMIDVELAEDKTAAVKRDYDMCVEQYGNLKARVRQYAMQLQLTQDRFADIDLDNPEQWDGFFAQLTLITSSMLEEAKKSNENRRLFDRINNDYHTKYPQMDMAAIDSLITAEFLYRVHEEDSGIDYAPIVVGFVKAIEVQIKSQKGLGANDNSTFGQLICQLKHTEEDNVISRLEVINGLRCDAAHIAALNREHAQRVRNIIYGVEGRKSKGLLVLFLE